MFQKPSPMIALADNGYTPEPPRDEVETVVGPSVHVEGDFSSEGNIIVKGIVSGNVHTSKQLTVEKGAKIFAHVKAGTGIISGEVKGNVKVDGRLELTGTAQVVGDIDCQILVVEAGALLYGKVSMKGIDIQPARPVRKPTMRKPVGKTDEMLSDGESADVSM